MILGEERWIKATEDREYEAFFKKARKKLKKKIKKLKPKHVYNPLLTGLVVPLKKGRTNSNSNTTEETQRSLDQQIMLEQQKDLQNEILAFEEKKATELAQIEEQKVVLQETEQATEQGEGKQIITIGLIALAAIVVMGAGYAYWQNQQHQMNALNPNTPTIA